MSGVTARADLADGIRIPGAQTRIAADPAAATRPAAQLWCARRSAPAGAGRRHPGTCRVVWWCRSGRAGCGNARLWLRAARRGQARSVSHLLDVIGAPAPRLRTGVARSDGRSWRLSGCLPAFRPARVALGGHFYRSTRRKQTLVCRGGQRPGTPWPTNRHSGRAGGLTRQRRICRGLSNGPGATLARAEAENWPNPARRCEPIRTSLRKRCLPRLNRSCLNRIKPRESLAFASRTPSRPAHGHRLGRERSGR